MVLISFRFQRSRSQVDIPEIISNILRYPTKLPAVLGRIEAGNSSKFDPFTSARIVRAFTRQSGHRSATIYHININPKY